MTSPPPRRSFAVRGRATIVIGTLALVALVLVGTRYVALNPDAWDSIAWGGDLARGARPGFNAPITPAEHLLPTLLGVPLSTLGSKGAANAYAALAVLSLILLGYAIFRLARTLGGTAAGCLATVLVLARPETQNLASHADIDVPFAAMVLLATALVVEAPTRNARRALALLIIAGLLRPEAWVLSGLYVTWLASRRPEAREFLWCAGLFVAAPALWALFELATGGDPIASFHGHYANLKAVRAVGLPPRADTTHFGWVPGQVFFSAIHHGIVDVIGFPLAAAGALTASWAVLRRRSGSKLDGFLIVTALIAAGLVTTIGVKVAGGPISPRYVFSAAGALATLAAAALFVGSPLVKRVVAVAIALSAVLIVVDIPKTLNILDAQRARRASEADLTALAGRPVVRAAVGSCRFLTVGDRELSLALSARGAVAATLDRDPSTVAIARHPRLSAGTAIFVNDGRSQGDAQEGMRQGDWVFNARCAGPVAH